MEKLLKQFKVSGIASPVGISATVSSRSSSHCNCEGNCKPPPTDHCNPPPDTNADGC